MVLPMHSIRIHIIILTAFFFIAHIMSAWAVPTYNSTLAAHQGRISLPLEQNNDVFPQLLNIDTSFDQTPVPKLIATLMDKTYRSDIVRAGSLTFSCSLETFRTMRLQCVPVARYIAEYYHGNTHDRLVYFMFEALKNAFMYGSMDRKVLDPSKKVWLKYEAHPRFIKLQIEDQGSAEFDPEPHLKMNLLRKIYLEAIIMPPKMIALFAHMLMNNNDVHVLKTYGYHTAINQMGRYFHNVSYTPHYENSKKIGGTLTLILLDRDKKHDMRNIASPQTDTIPFLRAS